MSGLKNQLVVLRDRMKTDLLRRSPLVNGRHVSEEHPTAAKIMNAIEAVTGVLSFGIFRRMEVIKPEQQSLPEDSDRISQGETTEARSR